MEELIRKALPIILNEGGGSISILLIANLYILWRFLKKFKAIEDTIEKLDDVFKKEMAEMKLYFSKFVTWDTYEKDRATVNELGKSVSKIEGKLNGKG